MAVITGATPAWPSHRNARLGPFEYDGKLYVVMPDYDSVFGTNRRIYVFESLDGGATWAHYVDTHQEESSDWASADAQLVGSVLYIAAARSGGGLALGKVDLATGVARKNFHDGHTAPVGADNPHVTGTFPIFIAVRSSSEVLVFHQGPMETVNSIQWRRHVYSKWESGVWVATNQPLYTTLVQEHHDLRAVILGIDGQRVHVFWSSPSYDGAWHRCLKADDTFAFNNSTLDGGEFVDELANYLVGLPTLHGTEVLAPYVEGTDASFNGKPVVSRAESVDEIVTADWDRSGLINEQVESASSNPAALTSKHGSVFAFYARTGAIRLANDQGVNSWTVPEYFIGEAFMRPSADRDVSQVGDLTRVNDTDGFWFSQVNEDPWTQGGGSDSIRGQNGHVDLELTDLPVGFAAMGGLVARFRLGSVGLSSTDPGDWLVTAQIFADDGTALTDQLILQQHSGGVRLRSLSVHAVAMGGVVAGDAAIWNGAFLRLAWVTTGGSGSYEVLAIEFADALVEGLCVSPVSGGVGVLYNSLGDVYYDRLDLYDGPWQYLRPDGDLAVAGWTDQGGQAAALFDVLNEEVADDLDYIRVAP